MKDFLKEIARLYDHRRSPYNLLEITKDRAEAAFKEFAERDLNDRCLIDVPKEWRDRAQKAIDKNKHWG